MKILVIGDKYVDSFGLNLIYELNRFNYISSVLHDYFIFYSLNLSCSRLSQIF